MYVIIAGGGKVGRNLATTLITGGHEVTVIERDAQRFRGLEDELEHLAQHGDATEMDTLERCGIRRAGLVVAATGDDEDNAIVCQLAREAYAVPRVIARVNDPRNQEAFDLLGIAPTVCPTRQILALIEHELPQHGLVSLLELPNQDLSIAEVEIAPDAAVVGKPLREVTLPDGARVIAVLRGSSSEVAVGDTVLAAGDQIMVVLRPGLNLALRQALIG